MMRCMRATLPPLRHTPRPWHHRALGWLGAIWLLGALPACATPPVVAPAQPLPAAATAAKQSALDARLFYELVVAELLSGSNDPGTGFAIMLKAAQNERDPQLFERAVEMALAARAGGSVKQALQAWLEVEPKSVTAHQQWLHLQLGIGNDTDIAKALAALLRVTPEAEQRLMVLAVPTWLNRLSDEPARRLAIAQQGLARAKQNPALADNAHAVLAQLELLADQPEAAQASTRLAFAANPSSEAAALVLVALFDANRLSVLPQLQAFLRQHPKLTNVQLAAARAFANHNRNRLALQTLEPLAQQPQAPHEIWLLLGQLQSAQHNHEAARANAQRFIEALPPSQPNRDQWLARAHTLLANTARQQQRYAEAEQWLQGIPASAVPDDIDYRHAQILVAQNQLAAALARLAQAPTANVQQRQMRAIERVRLLQQAQAYQRAYTELMQARQAFPDMVDWLYDQAMLAEKLERFDDMERWLRELMRAQPDQHHAFNALGYALADRNQRLSEAHDLIAQALQLAPGDPFVTDSMGWVLYRQGRLQDALTLLEQAWDSRADAEIAAHLGEVLWQLGQRAKAREVWAQGQQLQADHAKLTETMQRLDGTR